jgi:pSer/pThr/pTyr-binding forkhead associated (FHA) protein
MIWVEILSRHRDVASRLRIAGPEARIGRGYDNDVVVDDPYVAARHLRIFRDDAGRLVAEDVGSANGMFLDRGKDRLERIVVDGKQPIRIGQTFLRIRESTHEVERERVVPVERGQRRIALAVALGALILGADALKQWLTETGEPRISNYVTGLLVVAATAVGWVGIWALLARIFSGHARFLNNLLIALTGILVFSFYNEFAQYLGFAWTWSIPASYEYVAAWLILGMICFLHLREVGSTHLWPKGLIVTALLVVAIAVQTIQRSEAFSASGRQGIAHVLMPPAFRAVRLQDPDGFFSEIANLKATLDSDRAKAGPDDSGRF